MVFRIVNGGSGAAAERAAADVPTDRIVAQLEAESVSKSHATASEVSVSRRAKSERRKGDRRKNEESVAVERRGIERREKVNRRRQIDPTTCERDYTDDEVEFMNALDRYKRTSGRMFPTCSEVLEVLRGLGYVKQSTPSAAPEAGDDQVVEIHATDDAQEAVQP